MRKIFVTTVMAAGFALLYACGGGDHKPVAGTEPGGQTTTQDAPAADDNRGIGKFKNVEIPESIDQQMAAQGEAISKTKCLSCHKLTDERLVGPGWKGVTDRRTPEWIMNFITNTEEMLDKDPEAISQLEICLVRMPNQNLSDDDARAVYEYMRTIK